MYCKDLYLSRLHKMFNPEADYVDTRKLQLDWAGMLALQALQMASGSRKPEKSVFNLLDDEKDRRALPAIL